MLLVPFAAVMLMALKSSKTPVSSPEPTAQQIISALPSLRADSETGKAMAIVLKKLHADPDSVNAWITLGDILAQEQRGSGSTVFYTHAEAAYRRALKLAPRKADAMTGLAWVYGGRHQFLESIEWAQRALEVDPNSVAAHGIMSDAALEQGDYDLAFDHCQKMTNLRPDLSSWSRGSHLLWMTGSGSRATALMHMAIRAGAPFAENTAWCRARLAMMYLHDGALLPAAQALEPALKSAPDNTHVLLAAALIASAEGDLDGAAAQFNKVLEHGANHDALVALGDLCAAKGDKAAAEEYYARVEALHVANTAAGAHDHTSMAKFYADHDRKLDQAQKLADQHKGTRNVTEADVLAWVCYKNGDLRRAVESINKAMSLGTPDPEIYFHAGMIAMDVGDRVAAHKHLQRALSMNPRFHPLHAEVARATIDKISTRESAVTSSASARSK